MDYDAHVGRDLGAVNQDPLLFVVYGSEESCASGAVTMNIYDVVTQL